MEGDFPGGPVINNLPSHAEDAGSIPVQGAKIPHCYTAQPKKNTFLRKVHEWDDYNSSKLFQLYLLYNVWLNNYFLMHIEIFITKHFWVIQDHVYVVFGPCILELLSICITGQLASFHLFTTVSIFYEVFGSSFRGRCQRKLCFSHSPPHPSVLSLLRMGNTSKHIWRSFLAVYNGNQDDERKNPT